MASGKFRRVSESDLGAYRLSSDSVTRGTRSLGKYSDYSLPRMSINSSGSYLDPFEIAYKSPAHVSSSRRSDSFRNPFDMAYKSPSAVSPYVPSANRSGSIRNPFDMGYRSPSAASSHVPSAVLSDRVHFSVPSEASSSGSSVDLRNLQLIPGCPFKIVPFRRNLYKNEGKLQGIIQVDRARMNEYDLDELYDYFKLGDKALLRIAPTHYNYDQRVLEDSDDDVFLTEEEDKMLFPRKYGIDPALQREERRRFQRN